MSFIINNPLSRIDKLKMIDNTDVGEAKAGRALIVDSNLDISEINDININTITIGDTEIDENEMSVISKITKGEAAACKALVVNNTNDISNIHNIKVDSLTMGDTTINEVNIQNLSAVSSNEIIVLTNVTPGIAKENKVLIVNEDKDIGLIRNLSIDGTFSNGKYTFDIDGNLSDLGTLSCGNLDVDGTIKGKQSLTIDDTTLTTSELAVLDDVNPGTAKAGKVLVVDENKHITGISKISVQDLDVQGTSTIINTVIMNAQKAIQFEGETVDPHKTTLSIVDPTTEQTIFLPNSTG